MTFSTRISWLAASALLCAGHVAQGAARNNTSGGGIVDATTFLKQHPGPLAIPLRRVDHDGVATPSVARRFFKTDVLGVYGAAYLAQCTPLILPPLPCLPCLPCPPPLLSGVGKTAMRD